MRLESRSGLLLGVLAPALLTTVFAQSEVRKPDAAGQDVTVAGKSARVEALPRAPVDAFATVQGSAVDAANHPLTNSPLRLRDARAGQIVGRQLTDREGLFLFRSVEPGSYIVELVDDDDRIMAASQLLHINAGDAVSAIVKLPMKAPLLGGLLGHTVASAAAVSAAAAAAGVLALEVTGQCASPPCQ
jgi:hypothetical protein